MRIACKICGKSKDESGYYKASKSTCKECFKARARKYRQDNLDAVKAYDRERGKLPHRLAKARAYSKTEAGKAAHKRASKKWQDRNALKRAAHIITGNAVRDGKLVKQPCEQCGAKKVEAHHEDYERPLDVIWLCRKHHIARHKD